MMVKVNESTVVRGLDGKAGEWVQMGRGPGAQLPQHSLSTWTTSSARSNWAASVLQDTFSPLGGKKKHTNPINAHIVIPMIQESVCYHHISKVCPSGSFVCVVLNLPHLLPDLSQDYIGRCKH